MAKPLITALIDTYNHESFIAQAVTSVLDQDFPRSDLEILVVDDGSTDRTPEIIRQFGPRVRLLRKSNGGQASALNFAIPQARGEIIAFLDGDDWWAPEKLRCVADAFERNPEIGTVGHGYSEIYENGSASRTFVPDAAYRVHLKNREGGALFPMLKAFLGTSKLSIRKTVLEQVLPIPDELVIEADEFLSTIAVGISEGIVLEKSLFFYRLHSDNLFQFQQRTPEKMRRRHRVMACLAAELPRRLAAAGCSPEAIEPVMESIWVDVERGRLTLEGGKPWETYRVEKSDYRLSYKDAGIGYRIFKGLVLAATLLLPPRNFYRVRQWYSDRNLKRIRRVLGDPVLAAPIVERP
jgi:glycosyltransferase involved in cell wall biosynthesis